MKNKQTDNDKHRVKQQKPITTKNKYKHKIKNYLSLRRVTTNTPAPICGIPPPNYRNPSPILNVLIKMKNQNRSDYTIKATDKALTLISKHADLNEPEQVKQFIANKQNVSDGYKKNLCIAYNKYCQYSKIEWEMPLYKPEAK